LHLRVGQHSLHIGMIRKGQEAQILAMQATGCTSKQVEGICKAHPPSAARKKKASPAQIVQNTKAVKAVGGPTLNIADIPEAGVVGMRPSQVCRGKRSVCNADLRLYQEPSKMATDIEDGQHGDVDSTYAEQAETTWECPVCTFINAGPLPMCEMCNAPHKQTQSSVVSVDLPDTHLAKWPTLHEACEDSWKFCDASSIASSWCELRQPGDGFREEDDASSVASFCMIGDMPSVESSGFKDDDTSSLASFCVVGDMPHSNPATISWAARASAASEGAAQHRPKNPVLPVWCKQGRKIAKLQAENHKFVPGDLDVLDELEELNERRLHHQRRCERRGHR